MRQTIIFFPQHTRSALFEQATPPWQRILQRVAATPAGSPLAPPDRLASLFGGAHIPWAALMARQQGLVAHDAQHWACLEPVRLSPGRDTLILDGKPQVPQDLGAPFLKALTGLIAPLGWQVASTLEGRVLIRADQPLGLTTEPWWRAWKQDIRGYWPCGPQQRVWQQIFNELQMLMHLDMRPNKLGNVGLGQVANAWWLWGEGAITASTAAWTNVYADDAIATLLCVWQGTRAMPLAHVLDRALPRGNTLIILGQCLPQGREEEVLDIDFLDKLSHLVTTQGQHAINFIFADGASGRWRPKRWGLW
ncbi:MAG: hypothetical protein AABY83_06925 [Pseudomonadota bacterium]